MTLIYIYDRIIFYAIQQTLGVTLRKYRFFYLYALVLAILAIALQYSILSVWVGEERGSSAIFAFIFTGLVLPLIGIGFCVNFAVLGAWQEDTDSRRELERDEPEHQEATQVITVRSYIPSNSGQPSWIDWVVVGLLVVITVGVYRRKR